MRRKVVIVGILTLMIAANAWIFRPVGCAHELCRQCGAERVAVELRALGAIPWFVVETDISRWTRRHDARSCDHGWDTYHTYWVPKCLRMTGCCDGPSIIWHEDAALLERLATLDPDVAVSISRMILRGDALRVQEDFLARYGRATPRTRDELRRWQGQMLHDQGEEARWPTDWLERLLCELRSNDRRPSVDEIVELPPPHSGEYTYEEAGARQGEVYSLTQTPMLRMWHSREGTSFGVHITKGDDVVVYSSSFVDGGRPTRAPLEKVAELLVTPEDPRGGSPVSVLITCECDPTRSAQLPKLAELAFQPGVQVHYVRAPAPKPHR